MRESKIKVTKNVIHGKSGSGRTLCPMCIWWAKDAVMVQDPETDLYICSECGYQAIPEIGPIHEDKIEAGNERSNQKPYIKSVRLVKKTQDNRDKLFDSFTEAWNS